METDDDNQSETEQRDSKPASESQEAPPAPETLKSEGEPARSTAKPLDPAVEESWGRRHTKEFVYRRLGFYRALETEASTDTLKQLLKELSESYDKRVAETRALADSKAKVVSEQMGVHQGKLDEELKELESLAAQAKEWRGQRDALEKELHDINQRIRNEHSNLAKAKTGALEGGFAKRLEEIGTELDKVIDRYQLLSTKIHDAHQKVFNENPQVYQARVERLGRRRECAERAYAATCANIAKLSSAGLSVFSLLVMNAIGWVGVAASGWFYSVFVLNTSGLETEDYISFVLRRAITFVQNGFADSGLLVTLASLIAGWFVLLAVVTAVVWVCQILLDKRRAKSEFAYHQVFTSEEEMILGRTLVAPQQTALILWLRVVPYLFMAGTALILLAKFSVSTGGSSPEDLNKLIRSLSGKIIGGSITLVLTGLALVHIAFVVDRRIFRDPPGPRRPYRDNWEIASLFIAFVCLMVALLLYGAWPARGIAIASFAVVALLTAFTLAYGVRFLGLHDAERRWDKHIQKLAQAMEVNSRPRPLDLRLIDNPYFRREFRDSLRNLSEIIALRNAAVMELYADQVPSRHRHIKYSRAAVPSFDFFSWLKATLFGISPVPPKIVLARAAVTQVEEKLFPEIVGLIASLKEEWKAKKAEFDQLGKSISKVELRRSDRQTTASKKIEALQAKLDTCRREEIRIREQINALAWSLGEETKLAEIYLRDGFELAPWYRLLPRDILRPEDEEEPNE